MGGCGRGSSTCNGSTAAASDVLGSPGAGPGNSNDDMDHDDNTNDYNDHKDNASDDEDNEDNDGDDDEQLGEADAPPEDENSY